MMELAWEGVVYGEETESSMLMNKGLTPHFLDEQTEAQRGQLTCSPCVNLERELISNRHAGPRGPGGLR